MRNSLILALVTLLFTGCQEESPEVLPDSKLDIRAELLWLSNDETDRAALIFQEPTSAKFVQFAGNTLMIDLPIGQLSSEEQVRAQEVMERFEIPLNTSPDTNAYQKDLEGNVDLAVEITLEVFYQIFFFTPETTLQSIRIE